MNFIPEQFSELATKEDIENLGQKIVGEFGEKSNQVLLSLKAIERKIDSIISRFCV